MAPASVTGEVLGTPNAIMKEQLAKGRPEAGMVALANGGTGMSRSHQAR